MPWLLCLSLALVASAAAAEVPPRTAVGQTLVVPDADFERGQIFYLLPGQDTQLALSSTAPLQRTIVTTSRAVGYVVATFDPEDTEQPILGGGLRVPVASFGSDSPALDGRLWGEDYFLGAEHPELTFELTGVSDVEKSASEDKDIFPFSMRLKGKLTARGVSRDVEMAAEVRFLLTNFSTFARSVGDLITIAGSFEVAPADFGWELPRGAAGLIAPSLEVDVFLLGSTRSPENFLNPNIDAERLLAERRYLTQARDFRDAQAAAAIGSELLAKYRDDAAALTSLARVILTDAGLPNRDLGLASQLIQRARELDPEGEETVAVSELLAAVLVAD